MYDVALARLAQVTRTCPDDGVAVIAIAGAGVALTAARLGLAGRRDGHDAEVVRRAVVERIAVAVLDDDQAAGITVAGARGRRPAVDTAEVVPT